MTLPSKESLIDYLIQRKHPHYKHAKTARPNPVLTAGKIKEILEAGDHYIKELEAKTLQEIQELYDQEKQKEAEELKTKIESEEKQRFFNQLGTEADFDFWAKAAHWSLDEAIALSLGKAPEKVNWENVKFYQKVSNFAIEYGKRRELAARAKNWQQLFDPVLPGLFIGWLKLSKIAFPAELEAKVVEYGGDTGNWKLNYEQLEKLYKTAVEIHRLELESLKNENTILKFDNESLKDSLKSLERDPLKTRERDTLLKLIIGMAIGGYGYSPDEKKNPIPEIAKDLGKLGIPLDQKTIRNWLREAISEVLPPKPQ
jgi:hypothetical protein